MIFPEREHWDYHPESRAKDKDMGDRAKNKQTRKIRDQSRWLNIQIRGVLRKKGRRKQHRSNRRTPLSTEWHEFPGEKCLTLWMTIEPHQPATVTFQNAGNKVLPQILKGSRSRTATTAPGGQAAWGPFKHLRESAFSLEFCNPPPACLSLYTKVLPTLVAYTSHYFYYISPCGCQGWSDTSEFNYCSLVYLVLFQEGV